MIYSWIEEEKEDLICEQFGVGPGDIYRHVESAQWLLYAASVIADLFAFGRLSFHVESLRKRIHYGIKEELLELASLRGVGRVRARSMFKKGLKTYEDLKKISVDDLSDIPAIGKSLAKEIIKQVSSPVRKKRAAILESALE